MSVEKEQILRLEHLYELRRGLLDEMEEADRELSRVRMKVERAESDLRIGDPGAPDYEEMKGHSLPHAESRFLEAYRALIKLEEKITATKQRLG
jgi:DNA-binding transcriptional LysR family regulator